jgi:hypothetical protein
MACREKGKDKLAFVVCGEDPSEVVRSKEGTMAKTVFQEQAVLGSVPAEVEDGDRRQEPSLELIEATRLEVEIHISVLEPGRDLFPLDIQLKSGHRLAVRADQRLGKQCQQTRTA